MQILRLLLGAAVQQEQIWPFTPDLGNPPEFSGDPLRCLEHPLVLHHTLCRAEQRTILIYFFFP